MGYQYFNYQLSGSEQSLLKKGLSFNITLSKTDALSFVVPIENALRGLPDTEVESVRSDVSVVLKKATPTCANISLAEKKAMKRAKLMILLADKGRATVRI